MTISSEEPQVILSVSQDERDLLVQELGLKLEQTPVQEGLRMEYERLQTAFSTLYTKDVPTRITQFQSELLRNLAVSWNLQGSGLAERIAAVDNQVTAGGMVTIHLV